MGEQTGKLSRTWSRSHDKKSLRLWFATRELIIIISSSIISSTIKRGTRLSETCLSRGPVSTCPNTLMPSLHLFPHTTDRLAPRELCRAPGSQFKQLACTPTARHIGKATTSKKRPSSVQGPSRQRDPLSQGSNTRLAGLVEFLHILTVLDLLVI